MPTEYERDLIDFEIKNNFFLDMPIQKFVNISSGSISVKQINELLKQVKVKI